MEEHLSIILLMVGYAIPVCIAVAYRIYKEIRMIHDKGHSGV